MGRLVSLLALAFVSLGHAQIPNKKITFSSAGAPCSRLIPGLSKEIGVPLSTATSTKDDVLCVRFKDVQASEAMKKIAETLNASWRQVDGVYVLERTAAQQRDEQRAEHKAFIEGIAKALAKKAADAKQTPALNNAGMEQLAKDYQVALQTFNPQDSKTYSKVNQLAGRTPSVRIMPRITAALDPEELAGLPVGIKVVYSTKPTPSQRQFPDYLQPLCDEMLSQGRKWQEVQTNANLHRISTRNSSYGVPGLTETADAQPELTYITVLRSSDASWEIGLHFMDAKLSEVLSGFDSIGYDYGNVYFAMGKQKPEDKPIKIDLDDEDRAFISSFGGDQPVLPALRQKMLDPQQNEPLGMFASKWLLQIAEKKNENVVAYLADSFVFPGLQKNQEATASGLLGFWKAMQSLNEADNWITIKPKKPVFSRQTRIDRGLLGRYLRVMESGRARTIEEDADFALRLESAQSSALLEWWRSALKINGLNMDDSRMLMFYGALSSNDKSFARGRDGLRLRGLGDECLRQLAPSIYGRYSDLRYEYPGNDPGSTEADMVFYRRYSSSLYFQEPTVYFPDGYPQKATLQIYDFTSEVAYVIDSKGGAGRSFKATDLGWQIFSQSRPDLFEWMKSPQMQIDPTHLALGKRRDLTLVFTFANGMRFIKNLMEVHPPSGRGVPYTQLPATFAKQVQDAIDSSVKQYKDAQPRRQQDGNNKTIPPQ